MILTCQGAMQKKRRQEPTADKERLRIGECNSWQTGYGEKRTGSHLASRPLSFYFAE